jgi:nucleoside-diphosphate-sugar epimerase
MCISAVSPYSSNRIYFKQIIIIIAYTGHGSSPQELLTVNVSILETAILAVQQTSPNFQFLTLQTGGKVYGVEYAGKIPLVTPFKETMPRAPEPYASNIFYYAQLDKVKELSAGQNWDFVEVRPDGVVGYVPNGNAMNLAESIGLFLALYASLEGKGAEVPFPGNEASWSAKHTDTAQDLLGRFHIWASLNPDKTAGRAFNVGDEVGPITWADVWGDIASYFGLKGVGPVEGSLTGQAYVESKRAEWSGWTGKYGLKEGVLEGTGWGFMSTIMGLIVFDRHYDLSAVREAGFTDEYDTVKAYHVAFERMKSARMIPA